MALSKPRASSGPSDHKTLGDVLYAILELSLAWGVRWIGQLVIIVSYSVGIGMGVGIGLIWLIKPILCP